MIFVIKMRADAERRISRTIRDKSYQNYVGIALSTKVTMVDRNEPTDRMNGKEGIPRIGGIDYCITSQHLEPLREIGKREGSGGDVKVILCGRVV